MFTTCPSCLMNLAVTAMDLRIGQGYVRCGRCERVFNALLALAEDPQEQLQPGDIATGTSTLPAIEDETPPTMGLTPAEPESEPELDPEREPDPEPQSDLPPLAFEEDSSWARITPIRAAQLPEVDVVESNATGTFETIVLEGDGYLQTEEHVDQNEVEAQLQELARQMDMQQQQTRPGRFAEEPHEHVVMETQTPDTLLDADAAVGNAPRQHWGWKVAAAGLLAALLAQVVHHNRQALVAHPQLQRPLQSIYGALGANLEQAWDLRAYDLRQLGGEAMSGPAAAFIKLRATVHNRAPNRQPPPMIRAVLQDRFGNAVSTTAIAPQDYLEGKAPARMAPDQRLDVELILSDPNRQAVGFELDACLPGADGKLHCSNDP